MRVELNSALELGGLTPSQGLVELTLDALKPYPCKVIAMVRPRSGGFDYVDSDLRVMQREIDHLIALGVDGIAFGVLNPGGTIAVEVCQALIEPLHVAGCEAVFHRAFDLTPEPKEALEMLIKIGFDRVLTSGQASSAIDGAGVIQALIKQAADRIEVLPGGGVRPHNVAELVAMTGCTQVHASLRCEEADASTSANPGLSFNSTPPPDAMYSATDGSKVTLMVDALQSLGS